MESVFLAVAAGIFLGVGYYTLRWFLTDDRALNSEWRP